MGHLTRLLEVLLLLRACGRVKQSGLGVVPTHAWARVAFEAGWMRQAWMREHRPMLEPWIGHPDASRTSFINSI